MENSKFKLFEYEYSIAEFILSFVIVFIVSFLFLVSLSPKLTIYGILTSSGGDCVGYRDNMDLHYSP